MRGGVRQYVAQGIPQIDTEIGKKDHLWMETRYAVGARQIRKVWRRDIVILPSWQFIFFKKEEKNEEEDHDSLASGADVQPVHGSG